MTITTVPNPIIQPDPRETAYVPPKSSEEAIERMREDGDADPEGTARMNYPQLFETAWLDEIERGCEGVTPGPWRVGPVDDTRVEAADGSEVAQIDGDYNAPDTWPIMEANAAHISRLDPQSILRLVALARLGLASQINAVAEGDAREALANIHRVLCGMRTMPTYAVGREIEWCIDHCRTVLFPAPEPTP